MKVLSMLLAAVVVLLGLAGIAAFLLVVWARAKDDESRRAARRVATTVVGGIVLLGLSSILGFILIVVLPGHPSASSLTGRYSCRYEYGLSELTPNPDGTLTQVFTFPSGRVVATQGRWSAIRDAGLFEGNLWLQNTLDRNDVYAGKPTKGIRHDNECLYASGSGSHTVITISEDAGEYYRRLR